MKRTAVLFMAVVRRVTAVRCRHVHERFYASRGRVVAIIFVTRLGGTCQCHAAALARNEKHLHASFGSLTIIAAPRGPWGPRRDANGALTRRRAARVA